MLGSLVHHEAATVRCCTGIYLQRNPQYSAIPAFLILACASGADLIAESPRDPPNMQAVPGFSILVAQTPSRTADDNQQKAVVDAGGPDLPSGSRIVLLNPQGPEHALVVLTPGFDAAGLPALSFDAKHVLCVGRRSPHDQLNIWEIDVDGGDVRQVTNEPNPCGRATYLSSLYSKESEKPYELICYSTLTEHGVSQLFTCRLDGTGRRQITFAPDGATDPLLLSDGRLLFRILASNEKPVAVTGRPSANELVPSLFTTNLDGAELFPFATGRGLLVEQGTPCETDDESVIIVEAELSGPSPRSAIVAVDLAQSLSTRREVFTAAPGQFITPSSLPDGRLLAASRLVDAPSFDLFLLDARTSSKTRITVETPDWHEAYPIAILPRPRPPGRSSVVDERASTGFIYCLDATMSDSKRATARPAPSVRRVRILCPSAWNSPTPSTPDPSKSWQRQPGVAMVIELGTAEIAADGSFFLEVPARMPLRLETLSETGEVLTAMRSWFWVNPNETRGCIGCHEDRELSPPNRHVLALRKGPVRVGVGDEGPVDAPAKTPPAARYGDHGKAGQVP